ncbi:PRC-barrel domain-containing protein [Halalkalicoccus subterraneus]|uniref:PRC-barrel domain-containing protein n=1 Tax=Halalkalicoccus subterraneus TaxID=2675002 RepID=UPI000EFCC497|nr:PRC-barrel domain-containing protein [Halalkalicoccus subterraneus]
MVNELTDDLIGKDVETHDGQQVGTVSDVEGEQFYVNFTGTEMEKERQQEVHAGDIDEVAGETIVLVEST